MKDISGQLDMQFKEILRLVDTITITNTSRIREKIAKIIEKVNYHAELQELEEKNSRMCKELEGMGELREQIKVLQAKLSKKGKAGRKEILSEEQKEQIRKMYLDGYWSMPKLAKAFSVSLALIHKVIHS